jgi:hypothetical protein
MLPFNNNCSLKTNNHLQRIHVYSGMGYPFPVSLKLDVCDALWFVVVP